VLFRSSSSALVLSTDGRTRLVVNLTDMTNYNGRVEGNSYILEVGGSQEGYVAGAKPVDSGYAEQSRTARPGDRPRVTNIDFRRGEEGEGRVIINLSDDRINADVTETAEGVRLSLSNVLLPNELRRRLD